MTRTKIVVITTLPHHPTHFIACFTNASVGYEKEKKKAYVKDGASWHWGFFAKVITMGEKEILARPTGI